VSETGCALVHRGFGLWRGWVGSPNLARPPSLRIKKGRAGVCWVTGVFPSTKPCLEWISVVLRPAVLHVYVLGPLLLSEPWTAPFAASGIQRSPRGLPLRQGGYFFHVPLSRPGAGTEENLRVIAE
jgi:hypothetical protein